MKKVFSSVIYIAKFLVTFTLDINLVKLFIADCTISCATRKALKTVEETARVGAGMKRVQKKGSPL